MLVIGNLSHTHAGQAKGLGEYRHLIRIPDFHTGHLGFVPQKEVVVSEPRLAPGTMQCAERSCEIFVTPYEMKRDLMRISCTFVDEKGVVQRLVNLMSFLNVNIVTMETVSLVQSRHHIVNMVVDIEQGILNKEEIITGGERSKYQDVLSNISVSTRAGLELFLHIVSQCHQILTWKAIPGLVHRQIPEVYVSEFDPHAWTSGRTSKVRIERKIIDPDKKDQRPTSYFILENDDVERIAHYLGVSDKNRINYLLLLSDTESRSLRVQFFQDSHRERLFEIGFKHKDEVGALDTISRVVADSKFNVLSSLIRKIDAYHNVWEIIVEYQGDIQNIEILKKELRGPDARHKVDPRLIIKELLRDKSEELRDDIGVYDVGLFVPSHVAGRYGGSRDSIDLIDRGPEDSRPDKPLMLKATELLEAQPEGPATQEWLIKYANGTLREGPKVFISCPTGAHEYRKILQALLQKNHWQVSYYDEASTMEATYTEARRLVADADYLVGIWTTESVGLESAGEEGRGREAESPSLKSDGPADDKGASRLSPWMHFELGQAVAFEREFKILADRDLDLTKVVRRISADKPVFVFKHGDKKEFRKRVQDLLIFMDLNWRRGFHPSGRMSPRSAGRSQPGGGLESGGSEAAPSPAAARKAVRKTRSARA